MPPDQLDRLNGALAGRYALERELGQGGMATVYLAQDLRHHRQVAIKVLRPELAEALGPERFTQEIAIAARLNHPYILALHDSGEAAGSLFYVMPYIKGESLRHRLRREPQLPVEEALAIARQVASALDHAHAQELVHRDIKPENILLHEGAAMLADFGIALVASLAPAERLTTLGLAVGTPHYMSPEQAAGESRLDARSDLYSLGCVLYELLAGEPPYTGPTAQAVIAKRFTEPVPAVRRVRPAVPAAVEQALRRALAPVPADRFSSCRAFVEALSRPAEPADATPSVAVLPFLNLSPDPDNEFFADGIMEDVITQLARIRSLKVISRASAMRFKGRDRSPQEVGAALGVATVLDGSVRRAGDRVRVVASLIDAASERQLWGETYDRQLTDYFAIQTDVALQIVAALQAELSPAERTRIRREPTTSVQAHQLYLQGRFWYTRYTEEGIEKGLEYYRQAVAADPGYALAHTAIAFAYSEIVAGQGGLPLRPDVAYQRARESVTRALELDPDLGEAHSVLALLKMTHDFDWAGAEAEFKLALELSPGAADIYDHYGWLCAALERYDEALALVQRAQELDPLVHRSDLASTLLRAGRNEEALEAARRSIQFDGDHIRGRATMAWACIRTGRAEEGLPHLEYAVKLDPGNTLFMGQLGQAYAMTGRTAEARAVLQQLERLSETRYVSPYHMAYIHTGLGDADRAMDCLERVHAERAGNLYGIKGSFLFTSLRPHPRFRALLAKINLA